MSPPEGLLVVDKPEGPSSHDVVARVRRALHQKRVGHTGTLDPFASGVLPLVLGRATRLAQFMAADRKVYAARVRLGIETDSYDAKGTRVGEVFSGSRPSRDEVETAVAGFCGALDQVPPVYSAKKIAGRRLYDLARAQRRAGPPAAALAAPAAVPVTLHAAAVTSYAEDIVGLTLECSAGFYVRSLAHDLGARLGTGAHLAALRRVVSGSATLSGASTLQDVEERTDETVGRVVPMTLMLPGLPSVVVTPAGLRKVSHGQALGPSDLEVVQPDPAASGTLFKVCSEAGELLAIARRGSGHASGFLHPFVVLM